MTENASSGEKVPGRNVFGPICACTAGAAMVFLFCVVTVLVANHLVRRHVDPIDHAALAEIKTTISRYPADDELKETFRRLDTALRMEFYRSETIARRGAWLLASGGLVLLLSLQGLRLVTAGPPMPGTSDDRSRSPEISLTRRALIAAGASLVIFAAILSWRSASSGDLLSAAPGSPDGKPEQAMPEPPPSFETLVSAWPTFRGCGGTGISKHRNVPVDWDGETGRNITWKVTPPKAGFSSPVVYADKLFVTGADTETRELYCYDTGTGALLWTAVADGIVGTPEKLPEVSEDTGYAASTAATDGLRVYAIFATGDLMAVDMTGKRTWALNLGLPDNPYGHASSLQVHRGRVLLQYDHFGSARVIAFDGATGKEAWSRERHVSASWASPILVNTGKRLEMICNAEPKVMAYDADTGALLWECACMGGEVGPSPAFDAGLAFATTDYAVLAGIRTGGSDGDGTVAWRIEEELPDVASPVAADGRIYVATSAGVISCYESATGTLLWRHEFPNGFYASPLVAEERLYALDMNGVMRIVAAEKEFREIAGPGLGEGAVCTPAVQNGKLYIRGMKHLYGIAVP